MSADNSYCYLGFLNNVASTSKHWGFVHCHSSTMAYCTLMTAWSFLNGGTNIEIPDKLTPPTFSSVAKLLWSVSGCRCVFVFSLFTTKSHSHKSWRYFTKWLYDIQATTIMDKNNTNEDPPKRRRHQIKMKIDHTVRPSLLVCWLLVVAILTISIALRSIIWLPVPRLLSSSDIRCRC